MKDYLKGIYFITKRESREYFSSSLVYILAALFLLVIGPLFFNYLSSAQNLTEGSLTNSILIPTFGNMNFVILLLVPLITMKSFSEEKKSGTLKILFLSKLNHVQIILGKLFAGTIVLMFILVLTLVFPIILGFSGYNDWGVVFTSYCGLLFSGILYLSVGLFCSCLSKNQIVSAFLSFGILMGLMLLVVISKVTQNDLIVQFFAYISIPFHFENFIRGALINYNFIYFFSFLGFVIYLTHRSLESRKW